MPKQLRLCICVSILFLALAHAVVSDAEAETLLVGSQNDHTVKAVKALGIPCQLASLADVRAGRVCFFDYDVVIWSMDSSRGVLSADKEGVLAFIECGGFLLGMRCQSSIEEWTPKPVRHDKSFQPGSILQPEHPVFNKPNPMADAELRAVHSGSMYRAFYDLPEGWTALASTGAEQGWDKDRRLFPGEHYGLIELKHGKGRVLLCQLIPEYAWFHDSKGDPDCAGRRFFENLVNYAIQNGSVRKAARGARKMPREFFRDLNDLFPVGLPRESGTPAAEFEKRFKASGPFTAKADRRDVFTVLHPDAPSKKGSFGQADVVVKLPEGCRGAALRFYQSDDYCGGRDPEYHGDRAVSFSMNKKSGHRFKVVLVDGEPIWEEDVLGRNPQPTSSRFHLVNLAGACQGKKELRVALRVEDRLDSGEAPFATDVFWGAVQVIPNMLILNASALADGQRDSDVQLGSEALKWRPSVAPGFYRLALRFRDEHDGQSRVSVLLNDRPHDELKLTADDHRLYWWVGPSVELRPGAVFSLKAERDGEESCVLDQVAVIPAEAMADDVFASKEKETRRPSVAYRPIPETACSSFTMTCRDMVGVERKSECVTQGLPFPFGALKSKDNVVITDAAGRPVPIQARPLALWPDGSIKILLATFPTSTPSGGEAVYRVQYGRNVQAAKAAIADPVAVSESNDHVTIETGALHLRLNKHKGTILEAASIRGNKVKTEDLIWEAALTTKDGDVFSSGSAQVTSLRILERGPLRAIVVVEGKHTAEDQTKIDFRFQLEACAGSPDVRLFYTLTNREAESAEFLKRICLRLPLDKRNARQRALWMDASQPPVSVTETAASAYVYQYKHDALELVVNNEEGERMKGLSRESAEARCPGWAVCRGQNGIAVAMRWCWQKYPKRVEVGKGIVLDLLPAPSGSRDIPNVESDRQVGGIGYPQAFAEPGTFRLHRGEAITHEVRIRFLHGDGEADDGSWLRAASSPLRVAVDPEYTCSTLAFGQMAPSAPHVFDTYEEGCERCYAGYMDKRERRREYGMENLGDDTFEWGYGPSFTFWSNCEYDHPHGFLLQYMRSGDGRFWEIGEQAARFYRDVTCVHWPPEDKDFGGPRHHNSKHFVVDGWVADHTVYGCSAGHSWVQGLIDYWMLTGDPLAEEAWRNMGEWYLRLVRDNRYGAGGQERGPGWALIALCAIYRATYDERYLEGARSIADWLINWQDPLRGVISVPISEQPSYEGGTSFMHGIVGRALGRYYDETSDPAARRATIAVSEWLTYEAMGPPARFYYKQAPHCKGGRYGATSQCITALTYAYALSGDDWFGEIAEALYMQTGPGVRSIAWYPQALAHLRPHFSPVLPTLEPAIIGITPGQPGGITLKLKNVTCSDCTVRWKAAASVPGISVQPSGDSVIVPAESELRVNIRLSADKSALAGEEAKLDVVIECMDRKRVRQAQLKVIEKMSVVRLPVDWSKATAPMVIDDGVLVSPRPDDFQGKPLPAGADQGGHAEWQFEVPSDGDYVIWAECWWLDGKGNSLYVRIDDGRDEILGNDNTMEKWHMVRGPSVRLEAGRHRMRVSGREEGSRLRKLLLTNNPYWRPSE